MKIHFSTPFPTPPTSQAEAGKKVGKNFQTFLSEALQEVNTLQTQSDIAFQQLLEGDIEFHDAMIIAEKANLALQLTMAIRTKLLEAYQEIMRMQV